MQLLSLKKIRPLICILLSLAGIARTGHAEAERSLRFRLSADPSTLDWNLAHTSLETYVVMNLMEGLVEEGPDLKARPALAESWEVSADGLTYTFKLRSGIKWSDGRPLEASHFVDSWVRLIDPKTKSQYASFLFDVENAEAFHNGKIKNRALVGVKAPAPNQFQIKLRHRVPHFIHLTTFWVTFPIRQDLINKYGKEWATPGKIATLGPYLLANWKKGSSIQLKLNSNYFGTLAPGVATNIEGMIETDEQKASALFETGKIDFMLNAKTKDLIKAREQGEKSKFRIQQFPYLATYFLAFNVTFGPLKEREIRAALAMAINRAAIPAALQGGQSVANSFFPPGMDGHTETAVPNGSLQEARSILGRAGYVEGNGFPKLVLGIQRFDGADQVAQLIAEEIHTKLGIIVEPRFVTATDYTKASNVAILLKSWGADYPDAENFLSIYASNSGESFSGWKNAEFDALFEKAKQTNDANARIQIYEQAEKILVDKERVILPIYYRKNTVLLNSRIQNFQLSPLNYLFFKNVTLIQ